MKTIAGALLILTSAILFVGATIFEIMPRVGAKPEFQAIICYLGSLAFFLLGFITFILGMSTESWPSRRQQYPVRDDEY